MALNINGRMKVKTLKTNFLGEFGLTLRVYDGRSFADTEATLASIRKGGSKGGEFSPRKNTKVGNLEDKIFEMFGLKTQVAGSDDSYLCENDLTLNAAQQEDEKKLERRTKKDARADRKSNESMEDETEAEPDDGEFKINAGWEQRDDGFICRWILVWREINRNSLAGALGGYSGGGTFQMEQIYAEFSANKLTSLMIDLEDKITGKEIDFFEDITAEASSLCDDAQDIIIEWHDEGEWEDGEQLVLLDERRTSLTVEGDLLLLAKNQSGFVAEILKLAGITAGPS